LKRYFIISLVISLLAYVPTQAGAGNITGSVKVKGLRSPANVLVYLTNAPTVTLDLSKTQFVMDQQNLAFLPHILPLPVGATVAFPNHDKVDHNVFSLSRKPGMVELRCDVHAEMIAYIMVMKNPYFALTDAKGRFKIPGQTGTGGVTNLPPGKYVIRTWHEKLKTQKQTITVSGEKPVSVQLALTRGTPSVLYK